MKYCSFFLIVFCLVGCKATVSKKKKSSHKKQRMISFSMQEELARFSDVPDSPMLARVMSVRRSEKYPQQIQVLYKTSMSNNEIIVFYKDVMERLGWELRREHEVGDKILLFEKPNGVCVIAVRVDKQYTVTLL